MRDVAKLWSAGYALGASFDNTLVVTEDRVLNPDGLRFADEFVRHKALDAIGDLALAGAPLLAAYRSVRGGHKLNHAVLSALMADPQRLAGGRSGRAGRAGCAAMPTSPPGWLAAGLRPGRVLKSLQDSGLTLPPYSRPNVRLIAWPDRRYFVYINAMRACRKPCERPGGSDTTAWVSLCPTIRDREFHA